MKGILFILSLSLCLSVNSFTATAATGYEIHKLNRNFSASVDWTIDLDTSQDVLRGWIQYQPDKTTPSCKSIKMIQAARVQTTGGSDFNWTDSESNRNLMKTIPILENRILPGFFIDHDAFNCQLGIPCFPYFRDSWPNPSESQNGNHDENQSAAASLIDYPFGWDLFEEITLEACAQCVDSGQFLGCVHWGARWPAIGERMIHDTTFSPAPYGYFFGCV